MRLLLVEDDQTLVDYIKPRLRRAGFAVETASDGVDAEFLATEEAFDLIVLDLGLPKRSGLEVLSSLRERQILTPVLILTGRDSWQDKVEGLKRGADDYLTKPFHIEELLARLEAISRRQTGSADNQLNCAGITLDIGRQIAKRASGEAVELTAKEFRLLRYLMSNPDRVISKSELSEHIYEEERLKDSNVIEVYINRLRERFGRELIETHRGKGYLLQTKRTEKG